MNVLVTGSAGFIGFHVARQLLENQYSVTLADRFSDYYSVNLKNSRAKYLEKHFGAKTLNLDLAKKQDLNVLRNSSYSHIIHLAGQPGVRVTKENRLTYLRDNVTSFANVLELAVNLNVQNFLYASSSSIYQNAKSSPFSETEALNMPTNFYAKTKFLNEKLAESFEDSIQNICGLRFFSAYGPWGRPDMAYFKLFQSAYSGNEFPLNGNGEISRDFTYVGDVANAVSKLVQMGTFASGVLNIGGGNVHSMRELIDLIQEITGRQIAISYKPANLQDLNTTFAGTSKQTEILGFIPSTDLRSGLVAMNSWINSPRIGEDFLGWA